MIYIIIYLILHTIIGVCIYGVLGGCGDHRSTPKNLALILIGGPLVWASVVLGLLFEWAGILFTYIDEWRRGEK